MTRVFLSKFSHILVLGIAIRLILAPFFAHPFDMYDWYIIGQNEWNGAEPIWTFLAPSYYSYFLFVFPAIAAYHLLSPLVGSYAIPISSLNPQLNPGAPWDITVVPGLLFDLLIKLPLILSDTLVAILIHRIVLRQFNEEKLAVAAASMWFLNPLVIWVSSGWGTYDTLPVLFTVLSLYFLQERKFPAAGLALVVAIAMKYYAVVLVIPLLLIAWKEGGRKKLLQSSLTICISSIVLFLPLIKQIVVGVTPIVVGPPQLGTTYSGLSLWSAVTLFQPIPDLGILSIVSASILIVCIYFWMGKKYTGRLLSFNAYFGISIIPLLLLFRFVAENYFVWLVPFLSIFALGNKRVKYLLWALTSVAFLSSITNSLLPYYMLPMAPWIGGFLAGLLSVATPYRVSSAGAVASTFSVGKIFLAGLGIVSAALLVLILFTWLSAESGGITSLGSSLAQKPGALISRIKRR